MTLPQDEDRMVMLDDILLSKKDTLIDSISIDSEFVFSDKPAHCPHCHNNKIGGIFVMGAYMGNLLWECDECESIFLRFKKMKLKSIYKQRKGPGLIPLIGVMYQNLNLIRGLYG